MRDLLKIRPLTTKAIGLFRCTSFSLAPPPFLVLLQTSLPMKGLKEEQEVYRPIPPASTFIATMHQSFLQPWLDAATPESPIGVLQGVFDAAEETKLYAQLAAASKACFAGFLPVWERSAIPDKLDVLLKGWARFVRTAHCLFDGPEQHAQFNKMKEMCLSELVGALRDDKGNVRIWSLQPRFFLRYLNDLILQNNSIA